MSEEKQEVVAESTDVKETQEQSADPNKEKAGLQEALIAERRKRQEAEYKNKYLEQQYKQVASQYQTKKPDTEDEDDEYTREIKQYTETRVQAGIKKALEDQYIQNNPHIVEQDSNTGETWLEKNLAPILQKKPWLALGIQNAENRYARAMEIIEDYTPKKQPVSEDNRKRLEENSQKPGSPAGVAKSGNTSQINRFANMSRKEFSEYRASLRGRPPNIK